VVKIGLSTVLKLPFLSNSKGSVDDKGRLSIPADYRHALSPECDGHLVFTLGGDKYLNAFPLDFFNAMWERIESDSVRFATFSNLERDTLLFGEAVYRQLDSQGRITLPKEILDAAKIGKNVVFMGRRTHFTVWDAAAYEIHRKQIAINAGEAWKRVIESGQRPDATEPR
jgi:MraZ protein